MDFPLAQDAFSSPPFVVAGAGASSFSLAAPGSPCRDSVTPRAGFYFTLPNSLHATCIALLSSSSRLSGSIVNLRQLSRTHMVVIQGYVLAANPCGNCKEIRV